MTDPTGSVAAARAPRAIKIKNRKLKNRKDAKIMKSEIEQFENFTKQFRLSSASVENSAQRSVN